MILKERGFIVEGQINNKRWKGLIFIKKIARRGEAWITLSLFSNQATTLLEHGTHVVEIQYSGRGLGLFV